jgi:uncharacterized cupredoxin-like copper-binding protein
VKSSRALLALAATFAILATACSSGVDAKSKSSRTVQIEMVDIAFKPTSVQVTSGETVEFVFTNTGQVVHDAFIGDAAAQSAHETEMRADTSGGHGGGHDGKDEAATTVNPGKTGSLTRTFDTSGTVEIGCHQAGHYTAGMKLGLTVT